MTINRRAIITESGGTEKLQIIEEPVPKPSSGEVVVKIIASGVAFGDVLKRRGLMIGMPSFPYTPGYDFVGTVVSIGDGVTDYSEGETVAAFVINGGNADYLSVKSDSLVKVSEDIDPVEAAALILNYVTAYQMLHRVANIVEGESILVHGAAGGVGTALLQLASIVNVTAYGTASSGKHRTVEELGGTAIDYKHEDFRIKIKEFTGGGVDAVFDPIGGPHLYRSHRCLNKGGRLVAYGISSAIKEGNKRVLQTIFLTLALGILPNGKSSSFYSISGSKHSTHELVKEDLASLFDLLSQKKIKPIISEKLPLSDIRRAHELLDNSAVTGKVVLLSGE